MSDGLNIGTVKGTVELEDRMSSAIDLLEHKIESLDDAFGGLGHHFAETTASFFTAEAALEAVKEAAHLAAETLKEITIEGSHAADIEDTFEHLTQSAGQVGDVLLGKLRDGLRGTVTDMDLMKRVNDNMIAGLKLSDAQWTQLANGAFTVAKGKGLEAKDVLDQISEALLTGRVRGLAHLTGKIDLIAAEDKYAASLGTTADRLNAEEKLASAQAAIMEKVASAAATAGDVHVRLADKIQQAEVAFANFEEEVGTAIATSPVIAAGFDGIKAAIEEAFGDDQSVAVHKIATFIDDLAIKLIDVAEAGVNAAAVLGQEWNATKVVFGDIAQVVDGDILVFKYLAKGIAEVGEALHLDGAAENVQRIDGEIGSLMQKMVERGKALQDDVKAEDEWAVASGKVIATLEGVKSKMIEAQKTEGDYTSVIRDNRAAHEGAGEAAGKHGDSEKKVGDNVRMSREEIKKYNDAWTNLNSLGGTWEDTLKSLSPEMIKTIQYYIDAGASVGDLAAAFPNLTRAQIDAVHAMEAQAKVEAEGADTLSKLYIDYYGKKAQLYGTDTQKSAAAAEKDYEVHIAELQKKNVQDVEYYNELWDLRNKDIKLADDQRLLGDSKSKASLEKRIADAKDYFQFMMDHREQYTQVDVDAQRGEIERLKDEKSHWGEVGAAIDGAKDQVLLLDHGWVTDGDIAAATINKTTLMVKTLSGEIISLAEAQKRQMNGGAFDVTSQNFSQEISALGIDLNFAMTLAKQGYSMSEIVQINTNQHNGANGPLPPPHGPRIPGFRDGGVGDFGDGTLAMLHGPEAIVPLDKAGSIGNTTLIFNVNGTAVQAAQQIKDIIMRDLQTRRQF